MTKVTIIGAGSVGSTIAYTLVTTGYATEIVMIDINEKKALGEAMDIRQGVPFCSPMTIYAGDYSDAVNSDIVILTSGIARKPGQSRLELAQTNVDITKQILPQITKYAPDATYIIVSNPVDILTYTVCKCSGLPEHRVIGTGTILDTARLRQRLSEYYQISQHNVHACVMGEHGDRSFIPWSQVNISGIPILEFENSLVGRPGDYPEMNFEEIETYVRKSGGNIIERKGATYYAIAAAVCYICRSLLGSLDTTMAVSTMLHGEYGLEDVCLSILNTIGSDGAIGKILYNLNSNELTKLHASADALRAVIKQLDI